ncbi:MAG: ATP-binding cassette domain-containing protein [Bacteroidia bacterium]|nr:ATP-binding cassette domain-containing protein [Bacteroidia bacterium]
MAEYSSKEFTNRPVRRFFSLLSLDKREISHIYLYSIFGGIIYLSLPLGIQAVISLALANQISSSWVILVAVVTIGTILLGVLQMLQLALTESIQQKIFVRSSMEFAYRLPRIKMDALTKKYAPELVNRFFDTLTLQKGLPKILIDLSSALLQTIFGLLVLSFYHPFFIVFGAIVLFILFLIFRFTGPRGLKTSLAESDYKYKVVYWLEEVARTVGSFKLAGKTNLALSKTNNIVGKYLESRKEHFKVLILQYGNILLFKTIVTAGLLVLGTYLLIERQINVGQFVASEIIIITIVGSVEKLILSMDTIYDVLTAVEKIGKVTDLPLEENQSSRLERLEFSKGISLSLNNLSFTFPGERKASIKDINLDIRSGEKVCITGPNGSGKSMFLTLLSGLYTEYEGNISFNGVPLRNLDIVHLRNYLGDCLSQKNLFRGTILENLTMGNEDVLLEDVMWAIKKVGLGEYVRSLPLGLQTEVVPESPQIPYSITKKLIMARCLAKHPKVLLVDDFFSVWMPNERDAVCDFLTCEELDTVIAVSGERKYAQNCDRIIIMDQGTIVAVGTPNEILNNPSFQHLFN